ncbi:MAG: NAD(P)H-binding protein [Chloroflexota bacterium]
MMSNAQVVLVTGGTGVLGREVVARLARAGYPVRPMSRGPARRQLDAANVEWAQADLLTGAGLAEAVTGVGTIVHAASNPFQQTKQVDVEGTGRLLEQARAAGVSHLVYISIVGIDRVPLNYYRHKLAAEKVIEQAGVPYSILRTTQFHNLIDSLLGRFTRLPLVTFLDGAMQFQPIDEGEVAAMLVERVAAGPQGRLPDVGGPQVRRLADLVRPWLKARHLRRLILPGYLPGGFGAAVRQGLNTAPQNKSGRITWEKWLQRRYSS